jgi:hypothetical protein
MASIYSALPVTVQIAAQNCAEQGEKCEFTRVNDHFLTLLSAIWAVS